MNYLDSLRPRPSYPRSHLIHSNGGYSDDGSTSTQSQIIERSSIEVNLTLIKQIKNEERIIPYKIMGADFSSEKVVAD